MMSHVRYCLCLIVSFIAVANALAFAMAFVARHISFDSEGRYVWLWSAGDLKAAPSLAWEFLPIALFLAAGVIFWHFRRPPARERDQSVMPGNSGKT
jgi:hypothetical protein